MANIVVQGNGARQAWARNQNTPASPAPLKRKAPPATHKLTPATCCCLILSSVLSNFYFQALTFCTFVGVLVFMSRLLVTQQEFLFHKHVSDLILYNHFDASHNNYFSIRRAPDVWEWGSVVLWPGLLGNAGPCTTTGMDLGFRSSRSTVVENSTTQALALKGCLDNSWPDGSGEFHLASPTPYTTAEIVELVDMMDWFDGVLFRTVRSGANAPTKCGTELYGSCFDSLTGEQVRSRACMRASADVGSLGLLPCG